MTNKTKIKYVEKEVITRELVNSTLLGIIICIGVILVGLFCGYLMILTTDCIKECTSDGCNTFLSLIGVVFVALTLFLSGGGLFALFAIVLDFFNRELPTIKVKEEDD